MWVLTGNQCSERKLSDVENLGLGTWSGLTAKAFLHLDKQERSIMCLSAAARLIWTVCGFIFALSQHSYNCFAFSASFSLADLRPSGSNKRVTGRRQTVAPSTGLSAHLKETLRQAAGWQHGKQHALLCLERLSELSWGQRFNLSEKLNVGLRHCGSYQLSAQEGFLLCGFNFWLQKTG